MLFRSRRRCKGAGMERLRPFWSRRGASAGVFLVMHECGCGMLNAGVDVGLGIFRITPGGLKLKHLFDWVCAAVFVGRVLFDFRGIRVSC